MKIVQLKEFERIQEGLRSLTEEFIGEYPYYSTWIQKNEHRRNFDEMLDLAEQLYPGFSKN